MRFLFTVVSTWLLAVIITPHARAQSLTSGDITGTVTDPSGATVPNATLSLKNTQTGSTRTTTSSSTGIYRFALLPPGTYSITASAPNFASSTRQTPVQVGQTATVDFLLALGAAGTTVEITEMPPPIQTENGNIATTFTTEQLTFLPNPGGDLTYVAQTAPGVVMNTQATAGPSYGTFSAFGLPGTANLFTINGQNNNDPYFNVNNSGASNLLLGQNEISEATVVSNPYSAQYGQLAGAQVNYVTKSGNNQLHGDAIWWWNGRILNANNFFSNASGIARPFDNVNQWAASVGGPVRKDRTFFFANYEGLRMVFPSSPVLVQIPSPQFQSAVLANLTATGRASSVPFYQQGFAVYNGAPGAGTGTPISGGGCTGLPASALTALAGAPCILQFRAAAPARAREYQYAVRVDHQISTNDRAYVRIWRDNGTQPSYTDPLNPLLSSVSTQPQMAGNLNETHTFGSSMVNEFVLAGLYYSAAFGPANLGATTSLFPTTFSVSGNPFYPLGYETNLYPQGRRVTQYQVIDNLSKVIRSHTFRMGFNFVRNDISELGLATGFTGTLTAGSLAEFYAGGGPLSNLQQVFPNRTEAPLALYNLGMYFQDDWKVSSHLTVNIGFRAEHNSNPVCQQDCFSNLTLPFNKLPHDVNQPYNQVIESNRHQAYTYLDAVNWSPRIGFAWNPGGHKTVIRGGAGIMYNALPALIAQRTLSNTPLVNNLTVTGGALAPGAANGLWAQAAQANQQFLTGFASGATLGQIHAGNPAFLPPIYVTTAGLQTPQYQEWNLELQRELPFDMVFSANYVGNHGIHGLIRNWNVNAYCPPTTCGGATFLPPAPPDPRFGELRNYETAAVSRYNGLVLSLRRRLANGFQFGFNYTWSHSLDEVSNGGELPFDYTLSFLSIRIPEDPRNWRKYNYGNSDYDVRHYISANYVWDDVVRHLYRHGPKMLMGGWTIAGTIFYRTGLPFSVVDTGPRNALTRFNYDPNGAIMATQLAPGISTCARSAVDTPCFPAGQFAPSSSSPVALGNVARNQFRGPGFFDTDLHVTKNFVIRERIRVGIGAQFYNLFNHPNFNMPVNNVRSPQFGNIIETVTSPTSIFGSGLGGDASPRAIQARLQLIF